ncbi:MAG: aldo/keto reductase [Bacteroidales bacterium]|nr:aldo/keto reductase [Bacteroidales bacterium]
MGKTKLTRRQFMATVAAGTGSVLLGNAVAAIPPDSKARVVDPFKTITLGKTGIKTTLLGMGTGYSGYNRTSSITRAGVAESLIKTAYEKGIRYFDCADSYGTHPFTTAALKGVDREDYVLATKMWITSGGIPDTEKGYPLTVIDRFRKELNTDYLDIVQLHCMTEGDWTEKYRRHMDELEELKAKKIIRAHGVSIHSFEALEAAAASPWVDVVHVRINPFGESMDKKDPSLIVPVIEKFHKAGKGVIAMKLIGGGKLRDDPEKIDQSLKFVLGLGTVDMIIIGFEKPDHIDNYIERIRRVPLA